MSTHTATASTSTRDARPEFRNSLASAEYLRVGSLPHRELEAIMRRGEAPSVDALAGWEWRGMNTMPWAPLAGIKKFIKGFYKTAAGWVYGYNEPTVQNRLDQPWIAKPNDLDPKRFGFFLVEPVDAASRDNRYLNSVLLDYGRGQNGLLDPTQTLRDYLVRVHPGSDDLLLGTAYVALGPVRRGVPGGSYFVLERHKPTTFVRS
jgi:hypothetical protein